MELEGAERRSHLRHHGRVILDRSQPCRACAPPNPSPVLPPRHLLIFHLIAAADQRAAGARTVMPTVISDATAAMVAGFMLEIILPHLLRAEAQMFASDQTCHARWIAGYIMFHGLERIAVRDVVMSYKPLRPPETRRELDALMASLVSVSWLEPEEPSNPARCGQAASITER